MPLTQRTVWVRAYNSKGEFKGHSLLTGLGYIGIGWPEGGSLIGLDNQEKLQAVLEKCGEPKVGDLLSIHVSALHNFINVAQVGDIVVTRDHDGRIYVGTIISPYIYDTTKAQHFHRLRQVEWSCSIPSNVVSKSAQSLLNISSTFQQMQGELSEFLQFYQPPTSNEG